MAKCGRKPKFTLGLPDISGRCIPGIKENEKSSKIENHLQLIK